MKMSNNEEVKKMPDYLFEVSWEVCNKVGGIHTVIATKALTISKQLGDHYILIGPDVHREDVNLEFEEDPALLKEWKQVLFANHNIRVKTGRWKVKGKPLTILVDFSQFFSSKDDVLKFLWESYRVDSISGQWDYIEPVLFGAAAGKVIESYVNYFCSATDRVVAHFHEWMTASGGLYLQKHSPYVATVFTTHATVMGRCIAGNGLPLYGDMTRLNADELARRFNVVAKHSLEKTSAANFDCFATVSDLTARECRYLLGKEVDVVTPNGFEDDIVWEEAELLEKRASARKAMIEVAEACLGVKYDREPLIVGTSGRYEFKNKGLDVFVDSLLKLSEDDSLQRPVLAYVTVPAGNNGPRKDLQAHLNDPNNPIDPNVLRNTTHYFGAGVGPDHRPDQKFPPDGPGVSGTVGVRAFVSERRRRDFQQTLLRIAVRHGRDGIPVLLRAVGVYSAGKHRFLGADDHYVADRVRPVGRRQTERTQGRRRDRAQRYERFGSSCGHLGRAEKLLRDGSAAIRFVPGVGP